MRRTGNNFLLIFKSRFVNILSRVKSTEEESHLISVKIISKTLAQITAQSNLKEIDNIIPSFIS